MVNQLLAFRSPSLTMSMLMLMASFSAKPGIPPEELVGPADLVGPDEVDGPPGLGKLPGLDEVVESPEDLELNGRPAHVVVGPPLGVSLEEVAGEHDSRQLRLRAGDPGVHRLESVRVVLHDGPGPDRHVRGPAQRPPAAPTTAARTP